MPGPYSKPKGVKIEGGGTPKGNKVWQDTGKNWGWQPVSSPSVSATKAISGYAGNTSIHVMGTTSKGTNLDTGHWMPKDYNRFMQVAASAAMRHAYKTFPTWDDRNIKNNGTKLNPK